MKNTVKWLKNFSHLFFPHICAGCGSDLIEEDQFICINCYTSLPETGFTAKPNNPVEKIFYGRIDVTEATAAWYFTKSNVLQRLIHAMKYNSNQEVGLQLGRWMGVQLQNSGRFEHLHALIPLPLFKEKEKKRGYNQAAVLCRGISEIINVPVANDIVLRRRYTDTQTKKGRSDRWKNVDGSFEIANEAFLKGKHVLLVDDVVTTGATLEACGAAIVKAEKVTLSIAALAWASND
jgi:ComF family protein